ncbi:hypothetical protein PMI36_01641 [Pseudomonas sp. GM79]|uniref:hypothetical protein n=1 Tax=Pseudomonas sp. GM79 TaxID=1144338 RepID=UPI00026F8D6C|nr:hypothetical protein [Pseudomonas sp. GM79]EJN25744.1 hypothetical protein PMI36_01641 [Pseudomonas sp. GM79]
MPGSSLHVVRADNYSVGLTAPVELTTNTWEAPLKTSVVLSSGPLTVAAQYTYPEIPSGYSPPLTFRVLGIPAIISPSANTVQDQQFTLSGNNGLAGSKVEVFKDLGTDKVGESSVLTGSGWTCSVIVSVGPVSLTVRQVLGGKESQRSGARLFKIRPPVLAAPTVAQTNNTVTFSGTTAHTGATVRISKLTGPGELVLPTALVINSRWEIIATDWPFGTYRFSAIQDVPDNAGGRIPSIAYEFNVTIGIPAPTDVRFTTAYTPVISGNGINGAKVIIRFSGGQDAASPPTVVNGQWSSTVLQQWGPVKDRELLITQERDGQTSEPFSLKVTIPPQAPEITQITDNGLSPDITGTCWPNAVVTLTFSDSVTTHPATVNGGNWSFRRTTDFASGTEHTVTVTQAFAQQTSVPASRTFTVALPRPTINEPATDAEVGRDLTVRGDNGMNGATLKIRDAQYDRELNSKTLTADGGWSIDIDRLDIRPYFIDARQTLAGRDSEPSEVREFTVVVLPPQVDVPAPGADLPRIGSVSGTGMPGAYVTVRLAGQEQPLIENLEVDEHGDWQARVELEVGDHELWALQRFDGHASRETPRQAFRVVPLAPFIESPADGERVDMDMVVSGFADPGHTVILAAADAPQIPLGQTVVRSDRSWSMAITLERAGGRQPLIAVQWQDRFNSATTQRSVLLAAYQPQITAPAEGTWHSHPVELEGAGKIGRGEVVDWFNPESRQATDFPITSDNWGAISGRALLPGGHWFRFWQSIANDPGGADVRACWAETRRIEIEGADDPLD